MNQVNSELEADADKFAQDYLIPPDKYERFNPNFYTSDREIVAFAGQIGVHPGVVAGRLQHDKIIAQISLMVAVHKYEMLNKLKFKSYRKYLLDIQKIPYLIAMYISNETSSNLNLNSLTNETNENDTRNTNPHDMFQNVLKLTDKSKEKEKEQNQKKKDEKTTKPNDDFSFSFGAGLDFIDDNINYDDFSSDDATNEEEEKATNNEIIVNKNKNDNKSTNKKN